MSVNQLDEKTKSIILQAQQAEITEHHIYKKLAKSMKDPHNKQILQQISNDEMKHHEFYKNITGVELKPNKRILWKYVIISKIFGMTFAFKLMEAGEKDAQKLYQSLSDAIPEIKNIIQDEIKHENELINLINEERLKYVGSIVLGLNDGLVELTGALAGFTLALQWNPLIAMLGLITGIAGSLSMGASEYLSTKSENSGDKSPFKAAIYTGGAYILAVILLVFPFLLISPFVPFSLYISLGMTLIFGIIVIAGFTFYISVVQEQSFKKRFLEMAAISLGIATASFFIGLLLRIFFGVDV
ncbi:MAG: VIT1/CCC1 transporter family protein [Candidatus Helarchaeota archaeon]